MAEGERQGERVPSVAKAVYFSYTPKKEDARARVGFQALGGSGKTTFHLI